MNSFSRSSRNILNSRTAIRFAGETLFAKIGRAVCEAECLPRKEFFEAWETAKRIKRHMHGEKMHGEKMHGKKIVELAAGHGLLSAILLILDNSFESAVCVDIKRPKSQQRILAVLESHWPKIKDRVTYVESLMEDFKISKGSLIVSVHACGALTDIVLNMALSSRNKVAVLPCCHDLKQCDTGSLTGWIDGPLAIDVTRVAKLSHAGYRVFTALIPADITPKNRLIMAWPI